MEPADRQSAHDAQSSDPQPRRTMRKSPVRRFALIIAGFVFFDLLAPGLAFQLHAVFLVGGCLAGILAQGGLIVIWASLGTTVYWPVRQLQALLLTFLACCCLQIGIEIREAPTLDFRDLMGVAAFVPLMLLGAQVPLCTFRLLRGWRIAPGAVGRSDAQRDGRQFGILDLLFATAVVGVALGLVRLGLWLDPNEASPADLATMFLIAALASATTTLPCVWAALSVEGRSAGCFAIAVTFGLACLLLLLPAALSGGAGEAALLVPMYFATTGAMYGVLLLFRDCGYRLHSARSSSGR